jgi:hypothetical protein
MAGLLLPLLSLFVLTYCPAAAFHDCVQPKGRRLPGGWRIRPDLGEARKDDANGCSGGLCVGMHGGPHEGGPASYPSGSAETGYTQVYSTMTVPALPRKLDGIT